jgi:PAS domain S-box-containing protein
LSIIVPAIKSVCATLGRYRPGKTRSDSGRRIAPARGQAGPIDAKAVVADPLPRDDARFWLAAIADTSDDAIVGKNLDGVITSWNKAAEAMFGYTAEEIIGQPSTRIIPFDRIDEEASILNRIRRNERILHLETRRQRKDGRIIPVSLTVSPIRDDLGRIIGISKTARDLTEIQRVHRDLERREALLRSILDCMPDASIVIDKQGLILSFSLSAQRVFGFTSEEMIGQDIGELLPASDWKRHNSMLEGYAATGEHPITGFGRRRDGSMFPMKLSIGELDLPHARLFAAFVHDMTEQVERERALHDANAELEHVARELVTARDLADRSNRAQSHFLAGALQDLRVPLTDILADVGRLQTQSGLQAAASARVGALQQAATSMLQKLNGTLALVEAEIAAEQVDVPTEEVDVLAVAKACLDEVRPAAQAKDLTLRIGIVPGVQPTVVTDAASLTRVLQNLLNNAVKFTDRGSVELRLRPLANGSALRIEVADTGPGIPPRERRRLFRAFERREAAVTRTEAGAGVGLALSARLAASLGGCLGHHENAGGGSVFWLELPANSAGVSASAKGSAADQPQPLYVLVVDDVLMDRDIAGRFLAAAGHKVTSERDALAAVAAVAATDYDVVLMDMRMPGIDGLQAARRIRAIEGARGRVPIVAVTGEASAEHVAACREAGMDSHLAKPFDPDALVAAVQRASTGRTTQDMGGSVDGAADRLPGGLLPVCNPATFDRTAFYLTPEALESYLNSLSVDGDALQRSLRVPDALTNAPDMLVDAVHAIAGSAGLLGFERLAMVSRHFERAVVAREADMAMLADALIAALDETIGAIHNRTLVITDA